MAFHIGQPKSASLMLESQPLVIDAKQMQDGRLQVVNRHRVFDHVVAKIVRLPIDHSGLDSGPAHPFGEGSGMMVAPIIIRACYRDWETAIS